MFCILPRHRRDFLRFQTFDERYGQDGSWIETDLPSVHKARWKAPFKLHPNNARGAVRCIVEKSEFSIQKVEFPPNSESFYRKGSRTSSFSAGNPYSTRVLRLFPLKIRIIHLRLSFLQHLRLTKTSRAIRKSKWHTTARASRWFVLYVEKIFPTMKN